MIIVPRATWGARYAAGFGPAPAASELWLHHSETISPGPNATLAEDCASMRQLEAVGEQRFGAGISYTYGIAQSGRVLEGTGPLRVGSHTKGHNIHGRAFVLIGGYMHTRPTDAQLQAAADLTRHGRAVGWWTVGTLTGGHRDASGASTLCPGDAAWACIPVINSRALATDLDEDDDMTPEEKARLARIERGLEIVLQQLAGPGATLENPWPGIEHGTGWEHWRYNHPTPARFTLVDYLRSIDRQLNSGLDISDRPNPPETLDDAWGHVLSLRAEVAQIRELVENGGPTP